MTQKKRAPACRSSLGVRFVTTIFAVALVAACKEEHSARVDVCVEACAEPSCISPKTCADDKECAVGTTCQAAVCRPPRVPDVPSKKLLEGFRTDEFALVRGESQTYSVDIPRTAEYAICALLVAAPVFDNDALANAESCIARFRVFPVADTRNTAISLVLRLDDLQPLAKSSCQSSTLNTGDPDFRLVESLHLGCWAMDKERVMGASFLLSIDPAELPEFHATVLTSCEQSSAPTDGSFCTLPPRIGSCTKDGCEPGANVAGRALDGGVPANCTGMPEGAPCSLSRSWRGRCFGGGCVDQNLTDPLVLADCAADADLRNCFPTPLGTIGSCLAGFCSARCLDDQDCVDAASVTLGTCERPLLPSYLGVCKNPTESAP